MLIYLQEIGELKYRVIVSSPELLADHPSFRALYKSPKFTSKLFNITVDEAQCISQWSTDDFRPHYKKIKLLRHLIPDKIPFHFASATLPPFMMQEIRDFFRLTPSLTEVVQISNNRPNIHLQVVEMLSSKSSMRDLSRLLKLDPKHPPEKFMLFCNKRKDTELIVRNWWRDLPAEMRDKVGEIWGIVSTDAAGLGLDVSDVTLVIQWGYVLSLCTLLQRLGRAARNLLIEARAVYFVEGEHFDATRAAKAEKKKRRKSLKAPAAKQRKVQPLAGSSQAVVAPPVGEDDSSSESDADNISGNQAAMDAFINAKNPCPCLQRCVPRQTRLCCAHCSPNDFPLLDVPPAPKKKCGKNKIKLPPFTMSSTDNSFHASLNNWRERKMKERGLGDDEFYGPQLILPNPIRDQIIGLVHHGHLDSPQGLLDQTKWCYSLEYGEEILRLAEIHAPSPVIPPSPFTRTPLAKPGSAASSIPMSPLATRQRLVTQPTRPTSRKCGSCGQTGHICMWTFSFFIRS
ncbi:P-loop containing nucleoside triphosphate hydrolase protein [Mycena floridula]|nr:P-loop containing nucleoside triphosphate hydrolase protein [Mycena floridula]